MTARPAPLPPTPATPHTNPRRSLSAQKDLTALHWAAARGNLPVATLLVANEADLDLQNNVRPASHSRTLTPAALCLLRKATLRSTVPQPVATCK